MPGDDARVRRHLRSCAPCAAEARRLGEAVRLLDEPAESGATEAKGARQVKGVKGAGSRKGGGKGAVRTVRKGNTGVARGRLMAAARTARPGHGPLAAHAAPYAGAVASLDALLHELDTAPALWGTPVVHDWDVQGTLAHLVAADEALAERLGLAPVTMTGGSQGPARVAMPGGPWELRWSARTEEVVAYEHTRPTAETREAWRTQAHGLLALPEAGDEQLAASPTVLMGLRLPVADHYVLRALETWVHTRDIGRALGRPVPPPLPTHLQRFVGLSIRILDRALGPTARPVLLSVEGEAGGDWVLGSDAEPIAAELVLEAVDFCLLVGGRRIPAEIARGHAGDPVASQRVLETAASLAWL
ncbi:maleylpyruvate isomerase family mycothiol-dependent enzyme [Streptomyces sp. MST-110588]|nr:maleylpyruvate isomerase family mycothiol-dependent enzyme [Streptomyces sp. MST-110588]